MCYYQAIDYAIQNKIKVVEAGAQGTHKISRGYSQIITYSALCMLDKYFHSAVEKFLDYEAIEIEKSKKIFRQKLVYRGQS